MINGLTNVVLIQEDKEASRLAGMRIDRDDVIQVPPNVNDLAYWVQVYFPGWEVYQVFEPSGYDEF